ncbi:MAG: Hsp20/alpha crystallin family protein [Gammaproteobacteria bacterium]
MSILHSDPWSLLEQMRNEINRLAESREGGDEGGHIIATSDWAPPVDIIERDDAFVILADIPGVDPADIEINMENGVLSIKGQRLSKEDRKAYKRVERAQGTFYRRFGMPDTADPERISARSKFGVLEITIPKQEKVQPRRISVAGE